MSRVSQVYSKILDLFQDESRFTQGFYQRDKDGKECGWAEGYSFCAIGAINHFTYAVDDLAFNTMYHPALCCLQRVSEHLFGDLIQG